MDLSHRSHLNDGQNPLPILERTIDLDLEHPEDMNERTTAVNDHAVDRTIICHEFRDPLLGFNHFLNDLPPFVLQAVNFGGMNEEPPMLQFHEEPRSDLPDWPRHLFRAAEGQILCNMIRGGGLSRGKKKRFKEPAIKHAYLFLPSQQMMSTRCDRGPPSRPSEACDLGRPQAANSKKKQKQNEESLRNHLPLSDQTR